MRSWFVFSCSFFFLVMLIFGWFCSSCRFKSCYCCACKHRLIGISGLSLVFICVCLVYKWFPNYWRYANGTAFWVLNDDVFSKLLLTSVDMNARLLVIFICTISDLHEICPEPPPFLYAYDGIMINDWTPSWRGSCILWTSTTFFRMFSSVHVPKIWCLHFLSGCCMVGCASDSGSYWQPNI